MDLIGLLQANLGLVVFTILALALIWYLARAMVYPEKVLGEAPP